jgi:hypothetical protein
MTKHVLAIKATKEGTMIYEYKQRISSLSYTSTYSLAVLDTVKGVLTSDISQFPTNITICALLCNHIQRTG